MISSSKEFSAILPAARDGLPHVTIAMLLDGLADYGDATPPPQHKVRRTFRWALPVENACDKQTFDGAADGLNVLFICPAEEARKILEDDPSLFVLAVSEGESPEDQFEEHRSRAISLRTKRPFAEVTLLVQSLFAKILLWENSLKGISRNSGSLDDMLNASVPVLKNFIFVSDANFNVIGRTTLVSPPDALHKRILANNRLSPQIIAEDRFRLPEKTFYTREASDVSPFDRVSYPVHFSHSYFGSISMACNETPDTEGLRDLFLLLIKHMLPLCMKLWNKQAELNLPSFFFFEKLLRGDEHVSTEYASSQMKMAGLSEAKAFKLVLLDIDAGVHPSQANAAMHTASSLNRGRTVCFPYQDRLLILYHSEVRDDKALSHAITQEELEEKVLQPYDIICGCSSPFWDIRDISLAHLQTKTALRFKKSILREHLAAEEATSTRTFLFEEALAYYLLDPVEREERLIRHVFSNTPIDILHREDMANGTSHLSLLWLYLKSERNATITAKKLHMHRNTVLYHIERIEKRFDFSFSTRAARDWIYLCFKCFFLTQDGGLLENSLEGNEKKPAKEHSKPAGSSTT